MESDDAAAPVTEPVIPEALPPPPETAASAEFIALDPRVIGLWRLSGAIGFGIFLALLVPPLFGGVGFGLGWWWLAVGVWVGLAVLVTWWLTWYPPRRHAAWGYRIDAKVIEIRRGRWFQTLTLLPLPRLQHVDLQRGPLERSRGLASLVLHTAGTRESSITVPGLDAAEAARLRDYLVTVGGDDGV